MDRLLIAGTPGLGFDGPTCLARQSQLGWAIDSTTFSVCSTPLKTRKSWSWLEEVSKEFTQVKFVELSEQICPNEICSAMRNNDIVYRDGMHLSANFVKKHKGLLGMTEWDDASNFEKQAP